jgi:hypothetical protein
LLGSSLSPLFLYNGIIFPDNQSSGIQPLSNIILNSFTLMFDIALNECFKYSLIIVSSPEDLLFFNFFNDFSISSAVILAFIDFAKAFDTVWRKGLWHKLLGNEINGKMYKVIFNMYSGIKFRVLYNGEMSEYFPCNIGVRQVENFSLSYSQYI